MLECFRRRGIWWSLLNGDRFRAILARLRSTRPESRRRSAWQMKRQGGIVRVFDGEGLGKAKIVLSGTSNSTSSMLAVICYAWLMENKIGNAAKRDENEVVVPVINVRRSRTWKLRQAAWLFHHVGIDVGMLLFADEVDLENLMMSRKLNILVVGQDVLRSSREQTGTQDTGAMDESRVSVSRRSTSSPSNAPTVQYAERGINETRSDRPTRVSPQPAILKSSTQAPSAAPPTLAQDSADSRGRNKFSLAKWFGFGRK